MSLNHKANYLKALWLKSQSYGSPLGAVNFILSCRESLLGTRDDHYPVCRLDIRIVSLQPDADIQKLLWNGNRIRIRISETLLSMFRGFTLLEKVAHCPINHSLSSEASFQPSVPWLQVCLWCNLCTLM